MVDIEIRIPQRDFTIIRDLISERTGIYIRDTRNDYLEYRIRERMIANSLTNVEEYYYYLKYSPTTSGEFQELINLITVHETSFFRNPEQLESFKNILLKEAGERKAKEGDKTFRIWSAACSSGEEPVTLSIILNELFPTLLGWTHELLATDISTNILKTAKTGIFPDYRMENFPVNLRQKYFKNNGSNLEVIDSIKNDITYSQLNLSTGIGGFMADRRKKFDFVFCRNVFIYFPDEVKEKISKSIFDMLAPGGYLLLGNAESVDVRKVPFKMTFQPGGMIYQKPELK
ncbi:MAG: protein-glutamate O-methyltransferase CheR [Deltaproteobacteria bacterium]|nr:protein-glutamate O-methyltransferase CheR [Deltaproteobacteria bacterium]